MNDGTSVVAAIFSVGLLIFALILVLYEARLGVVRPGSVCFLVLSVMVALGAAFNLGRDARS